MKPWNKICCAVDLSGPARVAMEYAAELAKRLQAELTLVYVRAARPAPADDALASATELANLPANTPDPIERWRLDAEDLARAPVALAVLAGGASAEIVSHAREGGYDLIVIGTHGRTGIQRVVLGSVAEHVVRHAHCPVLVVRNHHVVEREAEEEEIAQYR